MRSLASLVSCVMMLIFGARYTMAGYLSLNMTSATQCGQSIVEWTGDDGPYHLLLTPVVIVEHGYNVWIPSIPAGTNSYNLSINQPAGLKFVLTMWGASGIAYAATTEVMIVNPSPTSNNSCFLPDADILGLYSFSFNISDTSSGYPPQCSNLSMSWASSLDSNVTGGILRRNLPEFTDELFPGSPVPPDLKQLDQSSSEHNGNTTKPPTMFGLIPLGNSFSIPITYSSSSRFAKQLPDSAVSSNPTTWTGMGVTHLNWTVDMAKGTRFILVAGIGSDEQWASGGSSAMLTVGQGSTGCIGSEQAGSGAPSVTASEDTPHTLSSFTDTAGITTAFTSGAPDYNNLNQSHLKPATRTAIACVLSIVGTLALVAVWYLVRRIRRRRHAAAVATPYTAAKTSAQESGYDSRSHGAPDGTTETQLDLIASREGHRILPPIITQRGTGSPIGTSSPSDADPFSDYSGTGPILGPGRSILGPSRSATYDSSASPSSTIHDPRGVFMTRNPSRDALLSRGTSSYAPSPVETTQTTTSMGRSPLPLMLHDRSMGRGDEIGLGAEDDEMTDLKRDTLAYLGDSAQPGSSRGLRGQPSSASAPAGRRRRREEEEMEYMVHRDAGRVLDRNPTENGARVLELPPRYEELDWDREREREERERSTR